MKTHFFADGSQCGARTPKRRPGRDVRPGVDRLETRELLSAGYFDRTFGVKGKVLSVFGGTIGANPQAEGVAVLPNGKMIVAGPIKTGGAIFVGPRRLINTTGDIGVVRLNANGTVDKTFANRGETVLNFNTGVPNTDSVAGLTIDSAGRIVIAGTGTLTNGSQDIVVVRLTPNGAYDRSFGINGRSYAGFNDLGFTGVNGAEW